MDTEMSRALVMGPGSSGTQTMASLLENMGLEVIHEGSMMFRLPGLIDPEKCRQLKQEHPDALQGMPLENCDWEAAGEWLAASGGRALVGFPYGFMAYYLRHCVPKLPIICLHRPKESWTKSVKSKGWRVDIADTWPIGIDTFEEFWSIYDHVMKSICSPVLHIELKDLSKSVGRIRGFLNL